MPKSREELQAEYDRKMEELQAARQRVTELENEVRAIDEELHPPFYKSGELFK